MNMEYCQSCGLVDDHYDENSGAINHKNGMKHNSNEILRDYHHKKKQYYKNRENILIYGKAEELDVSTKQFKILAEHIDKKRIMISVKPGRVVTFSFEIKNDAVNDDMFIVGIELAHPQPQFKMMPHPYNFGSDSHILEKKSTLREKICVEFVAADIGHHEMPIVFKFSRKNDNQDLTFIRDLVVYVHEEPKTSFEKVPNPYKNKDFGIYKDVKLSVNHIPHENVFKIPKDLKVILPFGLNEKALEKLDPEVKAKMMITIQETKATLEEGITKRNYSKFFGLLLWWEEIIARINIRRYNMYKVTIKKDNKGYTLEVPGLAEKRPSLLRGDRVYLGLVQDEISIMFECIIKELLNDAVRLGDFDSSFHKIYREDTKFNVRFLMSRLPMEHMHKAVSQISTSNQECRIFPKHTNIVVPVKPISKFYNELIRGNKEQISAVEHIASGTSGAAPYIVFGPPGTGKTVTIVEAIIQIVVQNPRHRVMVCTASNMAADHIALMLLQYNAKLNINNFILRANSKSRQWNLMPPALVPVSNGSNSDNSWSVSNAQMASYKIVVTTLLHAPKYSLKRNERKHKLQMSHLFIDEAGQASEPSTLLPITMLLAPSGKLILAGDPKQLGPVCSSRDAAHRGLEKSLIERLCNDYPNLYKNDPNYITMLINNFRSNPDILKIPNSLFYDDKLKALAPPDGISTTSILGLPGGERAVIFHAVNAKEMKIGKTPSYFNEQELEMVKKYTRALITKHKVLPQDIGIITPYALQVSKIKDWLLRQKYDLVEVGSVESFQGKEKRVVVVSTVRANCKLLDFDAKYGLGFLVDDKRFNVTLTRAKAKIIIIGNAACLTRDEKWRVYMDLCHEYGCYYGKDNQQLDRTGEMLYEITRKRFPKYGLETRKED